MKVNNIIRFRGHFKIIDKLIEILLDKKGLSIPRQAIISKNVDFVHNAYGTVIHPNSIIKDNVKIYQGVTLGRADVYVDYKDSKMKRIIVEEGAILCAGAKILCKTGDLVIGKNSVIGANSVLTKSTGENEIWCGSPARKIGERKDV